MTADTLVSICMPAYNSAAHIEFALRSLIAQTYPNIEIIVSDNASTDDTQQIVEALAQQDQRIRYIRQAINIGANPNYTFVARQARGEYIKWASSNDWYAPTFIERCLDALRAKPDAVVAVPRTRLFESDVSDSRDYDGDIEVADDTPSQRWMNLITHLKLNNAMNGLIRAAALRRTRLVDSYYGADLVMMGHLMLQGKLIRVDERLYYRRMERTVSTSLQDADAVRRHHYPTMSSHALFQNTKCRVGWLRVALFAQMPFVERRIVLMDVLRRTYWQRNAILDDIRDACAYLFRSHKTHNRNLAR